MANFKAIYKPSGVYNVTADTLSEAITSADAESREGTLFMVVATEYIEKGAYQGIFFESKREVQINSSDPANRIEIITDVDSLAEAVSDDDSNSDDNDDDDANTDENEDQNNG